MLENLLKALIHDLKMDFSVEISKDKTYPFSLNDSMKIWFKELFPGFSMRADLCNYPEKNKEDFLIWIMRANLLGQGTGGFHIGLEQNEKTLTLQACLPYEVNYSTFKEKLEDFVNYVMYWREEIEKFAQQK